MKIGVLMEPLAEINIEKNTSFAILLACQEKGFENYHIKAKDVWLQDGIIWAKMFKIRLQDNSSSWFEILEEVTQPLVELDVLFMRQDPPINLDYIYLTYLLEQSEMQGLLVVNKPASLRNANEKLFAAQFPHCCPKTLVTSQMDLIKHFVQEMGEVVIKPLNVMGGYSVFYVKNTDLNLPVILEIMTEKNQRAVMVQQFIPEIFTQGDKRILLIDGEPINYGLVRYPAQNDFRGNISSGATVKAQELTERDYWIVEQLKDRLKTLGLWFVGIDVIGNYLTEINVTSPTGVRELHKMLNRNIAAELIDNILKKL